MLHHCGKTFIKRKNEGKNYKPAKKGDKDRPSKEAWDRAKSEPAEKQEGS